MNKGEIAVAGIGAFAVLVLILLSVSGGGAGASASGSRAAVADAPPESGTPELRFAADSGSVYDGYQGAIRTLSTVLPGDSLRVIPSTHRWSVVIDSAGARMGYVQSQVLSSERPTAEIMAANEEKRRRRAEQAEEDARRQAEAARDAARETERTEAARAAANRALLGRIQKKHDSMKDVTWYHARGSEDWSRFAAYAYVGQRGGHRWMRVLLGTRTDSWLFWDEVIFNVDGERIVVSGLDYPEKETDVGYGNVREWADLSVPGDLSTEQLRRIAEGKQVQVRFTGKFYKDYTLGDADKRRLRDILAFHEQNLSK